MAAYNFPATLRIKRAIWHIIITNTLDFDGQTVFGLCVPRTRTIYIKKNLTMRLALRTFWHEVSHAFEYEYDLNLGHRKINKLEVALADLIRFNPDLVFTDWASKRNG
jgi:hypothetical protein